MDAVLVVFVIIMALLILISVLGGSIYPSTEKFTSVDPLRILGQPFAMWNDAYQQKVEGFADSVANTDLEPDEESLDAANDDDASTVSANASSDINSVPSFEESIDMASDEDKGSNDAADTTEEFRDYVADDYYAYNTDDSVNVGMDGTVVEGFPGNMYAAYAPTSAGACL